MSAYNHECLECKRPWDCGEGPACRDEGRCDSCQDRYEAIEDALIQMDGAADLLWSISYGKPEGDRWAEACAEQLEAAAERLRFVAYGAEPDPDQERWSKNSIQFPRLLSEIIAVGLTEEQWDGLLASMDLTSGELSELFDRAQNRWKQIVEDLTEERGPHVS